MQRIRQAPSILAITLAVFFTAAGARAESAAPQAPIAQQHLGTFPVTATAAPTTQPLYLVPVVIPTIVTEKGPLLVHLPGIGGGRACDRRMVAGLRDGGLEVNVEQYDWTEHDPGIHALRAQERNLKEAQHVADMLKAHLAADPASPLYLTGHSGGCGIAVWALERLPDNVTVDDVLLMAPALSPTYDLTRALRHVRGHLYAFSSVHDTLVLYTGTKMFGTMDGIQVEAAGYSGFVRPSTADRVQYQKLVSRPYDDQWSQLGNWGDHIGAMARPFASAILAPLLHAPGLTPTTKPTAQTAIPAAGPSVQ
ncbi:MAG: hypothetical protein M3O30_14790 [Planctomycetota bacterium]|nr:hypothetical protein [Planctomycetota bacterium]